MRVRREGTLVEFCLAWTLLLATVGAAGGGALAQATVQSTSPATTTVTDKIYRADGTPAKGTVLISWPSFTIASGASVPAGTTSVALAADGTLSVKLVANAGANPMGSYYTVIYHLDDGSVTREYWAVPVSAYPVQLAAIRSTVLPASVAMQTVSKSYVDVAIAAAQLGHPLDASTPYVLKTGDTMTGPLVLPGDPVTPTQASDKNYVDTQIQSVAAGLGQKVSTNPQATQQVVQPAGTNLEVNNLNGALYASQYATGAGSVNPNNNGIANAAASPDCTSGCDIVVEHNYASTEQPAPTTLVNGTVIEDHRNGEVVDSFFNPKDATSNNTGRTITLTATESAPDVLTRTGSGLISEVGQQINVFGLTGGSNEYPRNVQGTIPYFKTTYTAQNMFGSYNTQGQHVQAIQEQRCYGVGDCLVGSHVLTASGGFRDDADEGTHPYDVVIQEDPQVFDATCTAGCTTGSTNVSVSATAAAGTEGEGRYLIDTVAGKTITQGALVGGLAAGRQPTATFSGTNFAVSTFLETVQTIPSQANNVSPGTVVVQIATSAVPQGFATNTAALPATAGVACVADASSQARYETAAYQVVDGTHVRLTLQRPHQPGATIAVGGLCGYGLEQTVDTVNGIRQVFPVIGSTSATSLLYAGGRSSIVGQPGLTSAFANVSLVVSSIARQGGVVTVTVAGNFQYDFSGLAMTVQGVTDSSYNGTYVVSTTGPNTLVYTNSGPDSSSSGGTLLYLTGGYTLYPMAEVISVYNATTKAVDGGNMTLAANNVPWAAGDSVEEPHYYQELVVPDLEEYRQTTPRPNERHNAGIMYEGNNGPGLAGFDVVNATPYTNYYGNGGTHRVPDIGLEVDGAWANSLQVQAGEQAVASVLCNSHGCDKWNSAYNLFQLQNSVGGDTIAYSPQTSNLSFSLRGTGYQFTPQAFTAGTINVTTLNAGSVRGLFQGSVAPASLPVFSGSGAAHAVGAVPDAGATPGTTRYLREDGTWQPVATTGMNLPEQATLLNAYLMNEGAGTTLVDSSGHGNNATLNGPTWEGTQDLTFNSMYYPGSSSGMTVSLPPALNAAQTFMFLAYFPIEGLQTAPQAPGYGNRGGYQAIMGGTTQQHLNLLTSLNERTFGYKFHAFNTDNTQSAEFMPPGWHVFVLTCGNANAPAREFYDGTEVGGYAAQGSSTCPVPASGNYVLGGSPAYSQQSFLGKFAGMWSWSTVLSPAEAQVASASALSFLEQKGVSRTFRAKVQPSSQILALGDSRTIGYLLPAGADWLSQVQLTDSSYVRTNVAVASEQTPDMCNAFDLAYASRAGRGSGAVITTIFAGMSDMQVGITDATRIAANLRCVVLKAKLLGRVVLATEISGPGGNTETTKKALNAILRSQAFGWGVDNLADLATDPHIGADGASNNTGCFPDNLHPGTACEPYITSVMQNSINELLGSTETQRHASAAATVQEVAGDRYLDLTGASAQTVTLPDCTGYSLPRTVLNLGAAAAAVQTVNGQAIPGGGALAVGARGVFLPVPGAGSTGGCSWERTQ